MTDIRCRNCRFWQCELPEQYTWGYCRRLPPRNEIHIAAKNGHYGSGVDMTITNTHIPQWTQTNENHWCGEFAEGPVMSRAALSDSEGR